MACNWPAVPYRHVYSVSFDPMPLDFECAGSLPVAPSPASRLWVCKLRPGRDIAGRRCTADAPVRGV